MRALLALCLLCVLATWTSAQTPPSYARHVQPFFTRYCVECHNAREPEGGLNLESHRTLLEGGGRGAALVPGKPGDSRLVRMIEGKVKPVMPPRKSRQPSPAEIALVRAWVLAGARDDSAPVLVTLPALLPRRKVHTPISAIAFSPDGTTLAAPGRAEVLLFDPATGTLKERLPIGRDRVTALAYSRTGLLAVAASTAGEGHQVQLLGGGKSQPATRHDDVIQSLAFSPDGRTLATASYDRLIKLWDVEKGRELRILRDHSDAVHSLAFSPDGKRLASGGADRAVKVWDVGSGERLYTLNESTDWVYAVAFAPGGQHLAAAGVDRSIRVWQVDARGGRIIHSVFAHEGPITQLVWSGNGKTLWSLSEDRTVKAWDGATMTQSRVYPRQPETPLALAVLEKRNELALGRYDGTLALLDLASGRTVRQVLPIVPPPPLKEVEPNDSPRTGQRLELPVTIEGTLNRAGDLDWFAFAARAGQQVGVHLRPAAKSGIQPYLRLVDPDGNTVADTTAGFLGHTCQREGVYALGVRDREFRGGPALRYTLRVGDVPVVTSIFPLGGQRGTEVRVRLEGVHLGSHRTVTVPIPATAAPGSRVPVPVRSPLGTPLGSPSLVVGEFPEVAASGKEPTVPVPGVANGVLGEPGTTQSWRFAARKGQRLIVEVQAARIDSPLDSTLEILDGTGRPLPRAALQALARTYVVFRDHDSRAPGMRIEAWSELAVNDWVLVGSELLRIRALPRNPDDDCQFFAEQGQRLGFLGTTPAFQPQGTPLYKVALHPPGTVFAANGLPAVTLFWRNDDGGPGLGKDSRLVFDPPADGIYQVRLRDSRGDGGPGHGYRLLVRPPRPDFSVSMTIPAAVSKGGAVPVRVNVQRIDEFDGVIDLQLIGLPQGFHAPLTNMPAGENSTAFALFAEPTAVRPGQPAPLRLVARARIDGKEVVREATGNLPRLIEPGDIVTKTEEREVKLRPGGEVSVTVQVERRNGFTGRIPLEVIGLPHGVRVLDVGLNGILITPAETRRTFVLHCEPWVPAMSHPIVVLARREGKGTEHAAASVLLQVLPSTGPRPNELGPKDPRTTEPRTK